MRVTENATASTVRDSLNRSRLRMNDLQKQNASQKRVNTPSDDPVGNIKLMSIRNESIDNEQFDKNANLAKTFLNYTDASLEELTNLLVRAKDFAISQSSSGANGQDSRIMVAEELKNMIEQVNAIANRRLGDRYIFSGYRTNAQPFDESGKYSGDDGNILVEVQKDVFIGMNLPGRELFQGKAAKALNQPMLENSTEEVNAAGLVASPELQLMQQAKTSPGDDIFRALEALRVGLMTNDVDAIRSTLDPLDAIRERVITARAQVGSRMQGIDTAIANMARNNVFNAELQSSIEDSDLIQVVSDMAREETVLRASLQASNKLIQPSLLDFLR